MESLVWPTYAVISSHLTYVSSVLTADIKVPTLKVSGCLLTGQTNNYSATVFTTTVHSLYSYNSGNTASYGTGCEL